MKHKTRYILLPLLILLGLGLLASCSNNPVGPEPIAQLETLQFQPDVDAIPVTPEDIGLARKIGLIAHGRYIRADYGGFLAAPGAFVRIPGGALQENTFLSFGLELKDSAELEKEGVVRPDGTTPSGAITFTLYTTGQQIFHVNFPEGKTAKLYLHKYWLRQLGISSADLKLVHVWEDNQGNVHRDTAEFTEYRNWLVAENIPGFSVWAWTW